MTDTKGVENALPDNPVSEAERQFSKTKKQLDQLQKKVVTKFEEYTMGMMLLPPAKEGEAKGKINVLILMDDSDSNKMPKAELQQKLQDIITKEAAAIHKDLLPEVLLLSELWQACYDAKYDLLQMLAMGQIIFDKGMLQAVKITEIHKGMVLKKFEKYIVSYVLAGSLVQGRATPESDIDVFIVIDDTDVKKMTRAELKDKLRSIIIGMGHDAGQMTGIKNKLNIQVYIMTDFWDNIKEANPIIFTFLRDGIPLYDRGIFMPWKQLLKMGKVKPSPEAIDMYKSTGDQMVQRMQFKMNEVAMEDAFWATITPTQAAIMLYGLPPPTPKETVEVMRDVFVKKEKLIEEEYVKILAHILKTRKEMEHLKKKNITGKELDEILTGTKKYLERLTKLFEQITEHREKQDALHMWESAVTVVRDALKLEGVKKVPEAKLVKEFESVVQTGAIPEKFLRILTELADAKERYQKGKLAKEDVHKLKKDTSELIKFLVEHIQRKRSHELERARVRIKYGSKTGEVLHLGDNVFLTLDLQAQELEIQKAPLLKSGGLGTPKMSNLEELEQALSKDGPRLVTLTQPLYDSIKKVFGKNAEILVNG